MDRRATDDDDNFVFSEGRGSLASVRVKSGRGAPTRRFLEDIHRLPNRAV
jgi:hypothetical protein